MQGHRTCLQAECQNLRSAVSELEYYREEALRVKDQLDELRAEQRDIGIATCMSERCW